MVDDDVIRQRFQAMFEQDFLPLFTQQGAAPVETRKVNAAEYSAYQLGQISKSLKRLVELLEAQQPKT